MYCARRNSCCQVSRNEALVGEKGSVGDDEDAEKSALLHFQRQTEAHS